MRGTIRLQDAWKGYTRDQDKIISPQETVARLLERLGRVRLDILEEAVRIDNGRLDIPVYFSVCGRDAREVIGTRKQMGKGGTPEQAEASAVMELAERFSLFSFRRDPGRFLEGSYASLKDLSLLPFESIALSVHDTTDDLEQARQVFETLPLSWTWGYSLTRDREVLIPFDWFWAINEFNGSSAGNGREEAILQGVCEVVERHVSSLVSRGRLRCSRIDLDSVTDPMARELIAKYQRAGVRLFASDFTLDTGIPTVGVLAYDPQTFPEKSEIVWTAGTTPNPQKALSRALTEVAQLAGDFNTGANYVASGLPKFKDLAEARFVIEPGGDPIPIQGLPDLSDDNMRIEIQRCAEALGRIGFEVIVIDITHPVLEVPAFYTVIPGAHFRERAAEASVGLFTAKLIAQKGDPAWGRARLEEMERLLPGRHYVQFFLGTTSLAMGDPAAALRHLEESLRRNPTPEDLPGIYSYMGQCYKELGDFGKALEVLEAGEAWDAERTDIHNLKGYCYFKLKEHEKAIASFRRVLEIDPGSAIDYANIASNYRELGDRDQAIRYYQLALEIDPAIQFAWENLQRLQQEAG